jgi:energy-coupling factor transporter transmembrane protein EcfT
MLLVHPFARLATATLFLVAIFAARSLLPLSLVYLVVLIAVWSARAIRSHVVFVIFVTSPILVALVILWAWVISPSLVPSPHEGGVSFALFTWMRVTACGGAVQYLFAPLMANPIYLKAFLERTGLTGTFGTLIVSSIVFLPEIRRRFLRLVDARRSQGYRVSGLRALREVPILLMPLVSSLLVSATARAELWSHRRLLEVPRGSHLDQCYGFSVSVVPLGLASLACIFVVAL